MTKLSLEAYARLLAHVACRRGAPLEGILAELGVGLSDLRAEEPELRAQLAGLWENRKGIVAMKFAAALGAELEHLGPIGGEGEGPTPPARVPLLVVPPEGRAVEVPTYAHATPAAVNLPLSPSPANLPPPSPPAFPAVVPPAPKLTGTVETDLRAIVADVRRGSLPFVPQSGTAPVEEKPRPPPAAPSVGTGTLPADEGAVIAAIAKRLLPFEGADASSHAAPAHDEVDPAQLPLETYASMSSALARGEPREEVLSRHRLSAEAFDRLAKAWALRFQREPHLLARFKDLARAGSAPARRD